MGKGLGQTDRGPVLRRDICMTSSHPKNSPRCTPAPPRTSFQRPKIYTRVQTSRHAFYVQSGLPAAVQREGAIRQLQQSYVEQASRKNVKALHFRAHRYISQRGQAHRSRRSQMRGSLVDELVVSGRAHA